MQLVLGIIIGIIITIGGAYVSDAGHAAVCPAGGAGCPLVNWDEADVRFAHFKQSVESGWNHLTHH